MAFAFRPLARDDFPMLVRWFNAPHARGFGHAGSTLADVREEHAPYVDGTLPISAYVIRHDGRDVGLITWERVGAFPEMQRAYRIDDPDATNCDVILGEPEAAHRGLGPAMLRQFLAEIVFATPWAASCVIDPMTDNTIAIRAYEKAGFRFVRALAEDGEGNSVYLLELRRDELAKPVKFDAPYVRPARREELTVAEEIDDDACTLYGEHGLRIAVHEHPAFAASEHQRWEKSAREGRLLFACTPSGEPVAFASLGFVDGAPFLNQLSTRRAWMRRGLGAMLLRRAKRWSVRHGALWLTTYDGLGFNAEMYARAGFERVPDRDWGPEVRALFDEECAALPSPERRIVMRYQHQDGCER